MAQAYGRKKSGDNKKFEQGFGLVRNFLNLIDKLRQNVLWVAIKNLGCLVVGKMFPVVYNNDIIAIKVLQEIFCQMGMEVDAGHQQNICTFNHVACFGNQPVVQPFSKKRYLRADYGFAVVAGGNAP